MWNTQLESADVDVHKWPNEFDIAARHFYFQHTDIEIVCAYYVEGRGVQKILYVTVCEMGMGAVRGYGKGKVVEGVMDGNLAGADGMMMKWADGADG